MKKKRLVRNLFIKKASTSLFLIGGRKNFVGVNSGEIGALYCKEIEMMDATRRQVEKAILKGISKGVIYGTLFINSTQMGEQGVQALYVYKRSIY